MKGSGRKTEREGMDQKGKKEKEKKNRKRRINGKRKGQRWN